jgi:hypothetical protein
MYLSTKHIEFCSFCGAQTSPLVTSAGVNICTPCINQAKLLASKPAATSNNLTVSGLISLLQDFDPDCPVVGYYETTDWTYNSALGHSEEITEVKIGPIEKAELQPDGTVLLS